MKALWKLPLLPQVEQTIHLPHGARPVGLVNQGNVPMLFAVIETLAPPRARKVWMVADQAADLSLVDTSHPLGTVALDQGRQAFTFFLGPEA